VWLRVLRETGPGYSIELGAAAMAARVAGVYPVLAMALLCGAGAAYQAVARGSAAMRREQVAFLGRLIDAAEERSPDTVEHSERVSWWAERVARHLGVTEADADAIAVAAKLHDIGRIVLGLPIHQEEDTGPALLHLHPVIASDLLVQARLDGAAQCIRSQAERYDGDGYPDGLTRDAIPLASRVIAVADAYEVARHAGTPEIDDTGGYALARLRREAGTRFDPHVVAALEALVEADASDASLAAPLGVPFGDAGSPALASAVAGGGAMGTPSGRGWTDRAVRVQAHAWQNPATPPRLSGAPIGPRVSLHLVERQEDERRRIARELHDEVGGTLTWLRCALEALPDWPGVGEARASVDSLASRVHALSLDLRPAALDDLGLEAALARHVQRYTSLTGIRADVQCVGLTRRLRSAIDTAVFRIVQEALTNVAKHAGVTEVAVRVEGHTRWLRVTVEDAGAGFDPHDVRLPGTGSGLIGMRERAALLGGSLTITSAPGVGTRVEARLPVAVDAT